MDKCGKTIGNIVSDALTFMDDISLVPRPNFSHAPCGLVEK